MKQLWVVEAKCGYHDYVEDRVTISAVNVEDEGDQLWWEELSRLSSGQNWELGWMELRGRSLALWEEEPCQSVPVFVKRDTSGWWS